MRPGRVERIGCLWPEGVRLSTAGPCGMQALMLVGALSARIRWQFWMHGRHMLMGSVCVCACVCVRASARATHCIFLPTCQLVRHGGALGRVAVLNHLARGPLGLRGVVCGGVACPVEHKSAQGQRERGRVSPPLSFQFTHLHSLWHMATPAQVSWQAQSNLAQGSQHPRVDTPVSTREPSAQHN